MTGRIERCLQDFTGFNSDSKYMLIKAVSATPRKGLSHLHIYLSGEERIKEHKSNLKQHINVINSLKELLFIKNSKLYLPQYISKQSGIIISNGVILPKKLNIFL